ncbi:unnamed protein product [Echinostoma caproni]|uniref:CUB domain-containing protein n=1 Tax=Echinostoma caproni TaxID=27848 RepID=A0A183AH87_9TREM|nr:unnamed protein product [Echinostoma caproni]
MKATHNPCHNMNMTQCSFQVENESGIIVSPNYPDRYPSLADCNWTITVSSKHSIRLEFESFDIESTDQCSFDKLIVRDGSGCIDPVLATLCGDELPAPIVTSGPSVYIQFLSSSFVQANGFKIRFEQVPRTLQNASTDSNCGGYLIEEQGIITTPNYPNIYPKNVECIWKISAPEDRRISLKFDDFNLYSDCFLAHVDIYDGLNCSSRILRHCGLRSPGPIESTGSELMVVFRSSGPSTLRGFRATYVVWMSGFNRTLWRADVG